MPNQQPDVMAVPQLLATFWHSRLLYGFASHGECGFQLVEAPVKPVRGYSWVYRQLQLQLGEDLRGIPGQTSRARHGEVWQFLHNQAKDRLLQPIGSKDWERRAGSAACQSDRYNQRQQSSMEAGKPTWPMCALSPIHA